MSRNYPRFLYSNPQNTKTKGPFIVHTLDPFVIVKVSVLNPIQHFSLKHPYLVDDNFLYEAVLSKTITDRETLTILSFAIEWYQNQEEYTKSFTEWFYNLVDDNGANSITSYFKLDKGALFVAYDYLYKVTEIREQMILADRIRSIHTTDTSIYPELRSN